MHVIEEPGAEVEPVKHVMMLTSVASKGLRVSFVELTNKFAPLDDGDERSGLVGPCP